MVSEARIQKMNDIWRQLHGEFKSMFYWIDFTTTEYHYDPETDAIVADNVFKVVVELPTEYLTINYIDSLIYKLEGEIAKNLLRPTQ